MLKRTFGVLTAFILAGLLTASCYAQDSTLPTPLDNFDTYTGKLNSFTLVDQAFLYNNVRIVLTKDFKSLWEENVNITKLYFANNILQKEVNEFETANNKDNLLAFMKLKFTMPDYFFKKKITDEKGIYKENYQFEGAFARVNLVYTKEKGEEHLKVIFNYNWHPNPLFLTQGEKI